MMALGPRDAEQGMMPPVVRRGSSEVRRRFRQPLLKFMRDYSWKAHELSHRYITVEQLLHFYHEVFRGLFNKSMDATTTEVVKDILVPTTEDEEVSWVDWLRVQGGSTSGEESSASSAVTPTPTHFFSPRLADSGDPPTTHVVHAWRMRFADLLGAVLFDASGGKTRMPGDSFDDACEIFSEVLDKRYWICCFCVNQHQSICHEDQIRCRCRARNLQSCVPGCELDKFDLVAKKIHAAGGSMMLALESEMQILKRAWCVDEINYALNHGMQVRLAYNTMPSFPDLRDFQCDVERCSARPDDKQRILNKIRNSIGISKFNSQITNFVQASCKELIAQVRFRSRSSSHDRKMRKPH